MGDGKGEKTQGRNTKGRRRGKKTNNVKQSENRGQCENQHLQHAAIKSLATLS